MKNWTLKKLADAVAPTDQELKDAGKLPKYSREARVLTPFKDLAKKVTFNDETPQLPGQKAARPTPLQIRMKDGDPMRYFTDGSLRHVTGFKPGKAARKALKRKRRDEAAAHHAGR